jgi:ribonuclease Z
MAGAHRKITEGVLITAGFLAVTLFLPLAASPQERLAADDRIVVTLLGTGGPEPTLKRFGPATLVQAGGKNLLFDAGRGVTVRLYQLGISSGTGIDAVFFTHYHSDHVAGLPDLWLTGQIFGPFGSRKAPLKLWGPSADGADAGGVTRLAKGLAETFSDDIDTRRLDEQIAPDASRIEAHSFKPEGGVVFDEAGIKVTAFAVNHGDLIKPSVGYRIDYKSRSVTLSGDTKFDENLIKIATGTDLLIHEVFAMSEQLAKLPPLKPIAEHHTSPEEASTVFSRTKPKLAAYSHVVLLQTSVDELLARTRSKYAGSVEGGEDLMRFEIGDRVTVKKWNETLRGYSE